MNPTKRMLYRKFCWFALFFSSAVFLLTLSVGDYITGLACLSGAGLFAVQLWEN